jgi:hypothetical protein
MAKKFGTLLSIVGLCLSILTIVSDHSFAADNDLNPQKLVAEHLKSLGGPALLAKIKSRIITGQSSVEFVQGMSGKMQGAPNLSFMFISEGPRLAIAIKFSDTNYPGEYFANDGKEVTVGHITPGQKSPIAEFLFMNNGIIKEGLLGGALSTYWPLLDIEKRQPSLKLRKSKIEGRELYELEYLPKTGLRNMKIRLYFDPATYSHVRTEYKVQVRGDSSVGNRAGFDPLGESSSVKSANPRGGISVGEAQPDSYYTLVEKFEDFKKVNGMILPHRYLIEYSLEGSGQAFIGHWTLTVNKWAYNQATFDPKIFQALK